MCVAVTSSRHKETDALASYLDEMLHDATVLVADTIDQTDKFVVKLETTEFTLMSEVVTEKPILKRGQVSNPGELKSGVFLKDIEKAELTLKVESRASVDLKWPHNELYHLHNIKQFPIRCLMFRVGNTLLSIPLIEMMGVVQWTDELTQLPHSCDEVLGILKHRDAYLRVFDSLTILGITAKRKQRPRYILMLSDKKSAISCDILEDVVSLKYDDIQWHQAPNNNNVQGIIKKSLAHLLNPYGIITMVKTST